MVARRAGRSAGYIVVVGISSSMTLTGLSRAHATPIRAVVHATVAAHVTRAVMDVPRVRPRPTRAATAVHSRTVARRSLWAIRA